MSSNEEKSSTFDNLVSEISSDERKNLLEKIKPERKNNKGIYDENILGINVEDSLISEIKRLSLFKRLWFWLKAAFSNQSIEVVFNNYLVSTLARRVEHAYPGLIDYKHKLFYSVYYEKLVQLKNVADFFKPYLLTYSTNPGSFYVLLGNLVMPEIAKEIEEETDPYQYPFDKEVNNEMRMTLIHRQEEILSNLPVGKKVEVYASVRAVEWLKKFVNLPFYKMLSSFTANEGDSKSCLFKQIDSIYNDFTSVMCNNKVITDELLKALFFFENRKSGEKSLDEIDTEMGLNDFIEKGLSQVATITMFVTSIPLKEIACVVFNNSQYVPEPCGGGEDWFVKYKAHWKSVLNYRWEQWLKDVKKDKLKTRLFNYFNMNGFPLFPFRPWAKVWGGQFFQYEMTLGFIYAFFKNEYQSYVPTLKITSFEGEFAVRENRFEFTDTFNLLNKVNEDLDILANQLSAGGEYGLELGKYEGVVPKTKANAGIVEMVLNDIEKATFNIITTFGKCCRSIENLMNGMLSEHITAYYGPLTNLGKIKGSENKKYKEDLIRCKYGIAHAFELIKELESIDLPIQDY